MIDNPNNPHNVQVGHKAILDADRPNKSEVTIISMTPNMVFSTVKDHKGDTWTVMTDRLTPAKKLNL